MKERKCPNCNHWNKDEDYCMACGSSLSAQVLNKEYAEMIQKEDENASPSKLYLFGEKLRKSAYWPVRLVYYIGFTVWSIYMAIVGALIFAVAGMPG